MERVLDTVFQVSGFDTTVLLTGETGVGKCLIARVIHDGSHRSNGSFLTINCGAVPSSLIEAELFGYAPGAFTGAHKSGKLGLLEAADGGTLFLDEIDAFPVEMQIKLLTFQDTRSFIRVGGIHIRRCNVRLIDATNRELSARVREVCFREDLFPFEYGTDCRFCVVGAPLRYPAAYPLALG